MVYIIPVITTQLTETITQDYYNSTYELVEGNRVSGQIDDLEALKQTIYFILSSERYKFPIYSWNYGVELADLVGKPMPYVQSELKRRITEALLQDDRIKEVSEFTFEINKSKIHVTFTVNSIFGLLDSELEVNLSGV